MTAHPIPCGELSRALVIKLRHHGDVLLSSPVFSALRHAAPDCEIDALIYDETREMLEGHPYITQLHTVGRKWRDLDIFSRARLEGRLFSDLRARRYDLIVHLTDSWRGAWLSRSLRPKFSVVGLSAIARPNRWWLQSFTHTAVWPALGNRHTVECHLDTLRVLGIQPPKYFRKLTFHPGQPALQQVRELLAPHELVAGNLIHLHPASRWMFKSWSVAGYAELASSLAERGFRVVVTTGPAPREMALAKAIVSECRIAPIDFSGRLTLKQLGAVISLARLSICVDSVPMHMAAALGTPVIALFGPSNENEWGPWQAPHRILASNDHPCRPCRLDGCGGGKVSECLSSLQPADVIAACESLLAETA